jgi:hypothetical protein
MHACKHPKLIPLTFPITIIQGGRQENHGKQSSRESKANINKYLILRVKLNWLGFRLNF